MIELLPHHWRVGRASSRRPRRADNQHLSIRQRHPLLLRRPAGQGGGAGGTARTGAAAGQSPAGHRPAAIPAQPGSARPPPPARRNRRRHPGGGSGTRARVTLAARLTVRHRQMPEGDDVTPEPASSTRSSTPPAPGARERRIGPNVGTLQVNRPSSCVGARLVMDSRCRFLPAVASDLTYVRAA